MDEKKRGGEKRKGSEEADPLSGALNILGLRIDLGELLTSPESLAGRLEGLRERLEKAGGREGLSTQEWKRGGATVSGYIRTRGILGDAEYHLGTSGQPGRAGRPAAPASEAVFEPSTDVFDEGSQVAIVADVPGVVLEELELKIEGRLFSLATKPTARRRYQKELGIEADVDPSSLQASCRNGVLEVRLTKRPAG